jgi:hypothetical protein
MNSSLVAALGWELGRGPHPAVIYSGPAAAAIRDDGSEAPTMVTLVDYVRHS